MAELDSHLISVIYENRAWPGLVIKYLLMQLVVMINLEAMESINESLSIPIEKRME